MASPFRRSLCIHGASREPMSKVRPALGDPGDPAAGSTRAACTLDDMALLASSSSSTWAPRGLTELRESLDSCSAASAFALAVYKGFDSMERVLLRAPLSSDLTTSSPASTGQPAAEHFFFFDTHSVMSSTKATTAATVSTVGEDAAAVAAACPPSPGP